jgi:HSP20 family protein
MAEQIQGKRTDKSQESRAMAKAEGSEQGGISRWERGTPWFRMSPEEFFAASPFQLMRRFSDEMDNLFSGWWSGRATRESGVWMPPVEVSEENGKLQICAELPGVNKDDVKVEMTDEGLMIQGERKRESEEKRNGIYRSERSYGRFCRLIPLPEQTMNTEQVQAEFKDGLLKVTIPIPESQRRRREIPIGGSEAGSSGKKTAA